MTLEGLKAYRTLLRSLRSAHVARGGSGKAPLECVIRGEMNAMRLTKNEKWVRLVQEWTETVKAIEHHERLKLDYGWGVDRDPKKFIRDSATRVGLSLPKTYVDSTNDKSIANSTKP